MKSEIEIPERLRRRPLFKGYPVPFTVFIHADGRPDFRVLDVAKWREETARWLCSMCGQRLDYWVWFIGGEKCLKSWPGKMHQTGVFADPGMHEDCARYASKVCPFLAASGEYAERMPAAEDGVKFALDGNMTRPDKLGLFRTREFKVLPGMPLRVATGPIFDIEWFWQRPGTGGAK